MNHPLLPQETPSPILQGFAGSSTARPSSPTGRMCVSISDATHICLFSLASEVLIFKRSIIPLLNGSDHPMNVGAKRCRSPAILRAKVKEGAL